jgi:hypothetical protein
MSSIRSILEKIILGDDQFFELSPKANDRVDQALKEIEEAIKTEVIGEDEKQIRNGLRAEQRNRSKELFK